MASCRGHALAAWRTRDGPPRGSGAFLAVELCNRPASHPNPPGQHILHTAEERVFVSRDSRPYAGSPTPASLARRAHGRRSSIRTSAAPAAATTRVLWSWTTPRDGRHTPQRAHGARAGASLRVAPSNSALRREEDDDNHQRLDGFSLYFFFFFGYELHSVGRRYTVICGGLDRIDDPSPWVF